MGRRVAGRAAGIFGHHHLHDNAERPGHLHHPNSMVGECRRRRCPANHGRAQSADLHLVRAAMKISIAQRGFTLVELMIALLIALFLIGGLVTLVGAMKITFANQNGLSQLQESERMAMTLMTDVIESTGYFPNPLINTAATSFPVSGSFTFAGQALVGTGKFTDAAPGNTIAVRYLTTGLDNVINCTGNTSSVGA